MKRASETPTFDAGWRAECLALADAILAAPPASPYTERYAGRGELVLRIVLPLELAQPANRNRHRQPWAMAKERADVLGLVRAQAMVAGLCGYMIPGRPLLRAVRFSSTEPDSTAAWWKVPCDVLLPPRTRRGRTVAGLGLLRDDRPSALEVRAWHEQVKRGEGFALIEIWTGSEVAR
jgi:hypothetical protein